MGTDINNVMEDIEELTRHLEYFMECKGFKIDISKEIEAIKTAAKRFPSNPFREAVTM